MSGKDDRMLMIIGPCSAHDEKAVLEYSSLLAKLQEEVRDKLVLMPRIYTNKPRTNGVGYQGIMHQPDPNDVPNLAKGIEAMRKLHINVLRETGLSGVDEMLYPDNLCYLDDILSYIAVGARSVENQQHRLVSSGVDVPVGMKNPTSGDLQIMINAIYAAQRPHVFSYSGNEVKSMGNPMAHSILRGGKCGPNYDLDTIKRLIDLYGKNLGLKPNLPKIVVDASHDNSGKQAEKQPGIVQDVLRSREIVGDIIVGIMVESYLEGGKGEKYGQSITDSCLGWEASRALVLDTTDRLSR